jgi:hypothetical protein
LKTYQDQIDFFDAQWPALKAAAETGNADAVIAAISAFEGVERRVLYMFARQGLLMRDWAGKNLELYIAVVEAGIAHFLSLADAEESCELRNARIDGANIMAYNLSADLADCWEDDGLARTSAHFAIGADMADRCIAWRQELDKPAWPHSVAHWAGGMHALSLGDQALACDHWEKSLAFAQEIELESPREISPAASFSVLVGHGYLAIGRADSATLDAVLAAFREQLSDEASKADAEMGINQLELVAKRYGQ